MEEQVDMVYVVTRIDEDNPYFARPVYVTMDEHLAKKERILCMRATLASLWPPQNWLLGDELEIFAAAKGVDEWPEDAGEAWDLFDDEEIEEIVDEWNSSGDEAIDFRIDALPIDTYVHPSF